MNLAKPATVDFSTLDSWAIPLDGVIPLSPIHAADESYLLPAVDREFVRLVCSASAARRKQFNSSNGDASSSYSGICERLR
jgi:hypothetical protein